MLRYLNGAPIEYTEVGEDYLIAEMEGLQALSTYENSAWRCDLGF